MSLATKIPGASASTSKMSKKGWKCWALRVTKVTKVGVPFEGDRLQTGAVVSMEPGDILLHVDDSSMHGIGVILPRPDGEQGEISWIETASDSHSMLTAAAMKLVAMSPAERISLGATELLKDVDDVPAEARPHYQKLASSEATYDAIDLTRVPTEALVRELANRGVRI
jgi:hypothetical protein